MNERLGMKGCKAGKAFYVVASFHLRGHSSLRGPLTEPSHDGNFERCHRLPHQCMSVDTQPHHDVLAVAIVGKTVRSSAHRARTLVVLHARDTGRLHRGDAVTSPSTSTAVRLDRASTGVTKHEETSLVHIAWYWSKEIFMWCRCGAGVQSTCCSVLQGKGLVAQVAGRRRSDLRQALCSRSRGPECSSKFGRRSLSPGSFSERKAERPS